MRFYKPLRWFLWIAVVGSAAQGRCEEDKPLNDGSQVAERILDQTRTINAIDFGMTSGSPADQSSALARALRHAAENPQIDTVHIPEGTYYFAQPICPEPGVNLVGAGIGKTILERRNSAVYLVQGKHFNGRGATIAHLTLRNRDRTLLLQHVNHLRFIQTEFSGGIVRFEDCSKITLDDNVFNDNHGKSAYASSQCADMQIVFNTFHSVEHGSINLSGHKNCYVAWNLVTSPTLIDSGYAGIRLPNRAHGNVVEHNLIVNHGRGVFVLSSSENNVIRDNIIQDTKQQGVLIQSSRNDLQQNTIIDAGDEAIYVVDASAESSPTPSVANENRVRDNRIYDTRHHGDSRFVGLKILSQRNAIVGNTVSGEFGRQFKSIPSESQNEDRDNTYVDKVERVDLERWFQTRNRLAGQPRQTTEEQQHERDAQR